MGSKRRGGQNLLDRERNNSALEFLSNTGGRGLGLERRGLKFNRWMNEVCRFDKRGRG